MLVHQFEPEPDRAPTASQLQDMDAVLTARFSYPILRGAGRTVRQLLGLHRLPWHVAKAIPPDPAARRRVSDFAPDVIWLEGPWLGEFARRVHEDTGAPIAYRSHNIEHLYLRRQAAASRSLRNRVAWTLATLGLAKYELDLMREARLVFDISIDDLASWRAHGVENIRPLPPLSEVAISGPPASRIPGDVVFAGGLRLPNNIHGVRWLVDSVLPILLAARPDLTLSIVGSAPAADLRKELEANPAVRTFFDVPSVNPYLFGAAVLVNPVSIGSGVQLKMLDMLMTDAPIVTTTQGVRGLPPASHAQFEVADSPEDFATAILSRMHHPAIDPESRSRARDDFGLACIADALTAVTHDASSAAT